MGSQDGRHADPRRSLDRRAGRRATRSRAGPRGPVCVLAGAGTGKTRTITHRIAQLVAGGHVAANQVLAVTFTQRAAGEMRSRLRALAAAAGTDAAVGSVSALTFHAAAHRQLRYFWPRVVGDTGWQLLDSKFAVVARRPAAPGSTPAPTTCATWPARSSGPRRR
ncbi:uvrD/REP helicase N-terminal domain protein [Mycobacterium avium subsp. avium 2285 (R)]|nr:uvrD/REP helicase N-terminal domain protein [Mycobacterium avium subsp. avium 2285 (R)]